MTAENPKIREAEGYKKAIEQEKNAIARFKNPKILENIKSELDRDHIGDDKEKMFVFLSACSSRLHPSYRFSVALTGYFSEGKTNLWKSIAKHLPGHWYVDLTRITRASLEDDIKNYNLIYFILHIVCLYLYL